jgi:hypothetical protein
MGTPVLIGAGVGALGSAVMGKDPLKGAAIGGTLGAGYGGATSAMKGGSFLEGAFPFLGETVKPAAMGTIAQGGGATLPAFAPEIGMANTFNLASNAVTNPANLSGIVSNYSPAIMSAAGQGGLNAAVTSVPMSQQLGYSLDEIKNMLPDLSAQNVGNVIGGAAVARQFMQRPQVPQAQSGGIKQGNPPSVTPINELLGLSKPQPKKRISLLVG